MAHLTFKHDKLKHLLEDAETRWKLHVRPLWDKDTGPGFWIVGDDGVYLMHNGEPTETESQHVVYAEECSPVSMAFEDWWSMKQETFGGDDGADFIDRDIIEQAVAAESDLVIDFTAGEMTLTLPGLLWVTKPDAAQ